MKICVVASTFPRTEDDPAVPWLRDELKRLKARGHDVRVFAPAFKGSPSHEIEGIPVHRFRYFFAFKEDLTHDSGAPTKIRRPDYLLLTLFYILAGTLSLTRWQRKERFDVLHIHWPFPHGLFGVTAARFTPAPLVMSFHGAELLLAKKFPFVNPALRWFTRRAQAVTCNSSYTAAAIKKLGTCEVIVCPFGSPIPEHATPLPTNTVKQILFVGRLIERKGVEYLLRALPLVQEQIPAQLVIVGNGVLLDTLKAQVVEMGLQDSVTFRVDIPESELMEAYRQSDVFVLPAIVDSRGDTEGLGVVLIEALSFRRPVVASEVGGIVDVVQHEKTGLLVPEKDPQALANALARVLADPALAQRLAEDGYAHVQEVFDWDRILDDLEVLYQDITSADTSGQTRDAARSRAA